MITSSEQTKRSVLVESHELNYDSSDALFWMRLVMGDDWFQRVKSNFDFAPIAYAILKNEARVSFATTVQAQEFEVWLIEANERVDYGYRTMRG